MADTMAEAVLAGVAFALVAGALFLVVRVIRWMTHADERDEAARTDWEKRNSEDPGLAQRAATATKKNPLGDLTWNDIKPREDSEGPGQRAATAEYQELSKKVEQRTSEIIQKSAAVATGAVKGANASLPRWLKVVLFLAAGWIVLLILGA